MKESNDKPTVLTVKRGAPLAPYLTQQLPECDIEEATYGTVMQSEHLSTAGVVVIDCDLGGEESLQLARDIIELKTDAAIILRHLSRDDGMIETGDLQVTLSGFDSLVGNIRRLLAAQIDEPSPGAEAQQVE